MHREILGSSQLPEYFMVNSRESILRMQGITSVYEERIYSSLQLADFLMVIQNDFDL